MNTITSREGAAAGRTRPLRSLTALAGAAALGASLALGAAPALADEAPVSVEGGSAVWGVKQSFRNYVSGPIGGGGYEAVGGASVNADGTLDFPTVQGSVSKEDSSGEVSFSGGVVFTGHDYGRGPVLEIHVNDPRVEFDGAGSATVYADITSREFKGANPALPPGDLISYGEVAVTELTGAGVEVDGDGNLTGRGQGALAFAGNCFRADVGYSDVRMDATFDLTIAGTTAGSQYDAHARLIAHRCCGPAPPGKRKSRPGGRLSGKQGRVRVCAGRLRAGPGERLQPRRGAGRAQTAGIPARHPTQGSGDAEPRRRGHSAHAVPASVTG